MNNIKDLVIIGGGPAACAAAVYAERKKLMSVIITQEWGGQSVVSADVQNWIGVPHIAGSDIAKILRQHVQEYSSGVMEIIEGDVVEQVTHNEHFKITTKNGKEFTAFGVIVCSGSSRKTLDVKGAEELNHKGISYCASCDAPLFSGVNVAVVGGGNAGFEGALQLLDHATKVTLLEINEEFAADKLTVERVMSSAKFTALTQVKIKEITGKGKVDGLIYEDKDGKENKLDLGGVFVEIGSVPNSYFVKDLIELNEIGEIIVDPKTQQASMEGVWAAGDVADGLFKQNNISMGDAVKALEDAYLYIQKIKV